MSDARAAPDAAVADIWRSATPVEVPGEEEEEEEEEEKEEEEEEEEWRRT